MKKTFKLNSTFQFFFDSFGILVVFQISFFSFPYSIFNKYQILFWKNIKIEKYKIYIFS